MKLSQLVLLKEQLNQIPFDSLQTALSRVSDELTYITQDTDYSLTNDQDVLVQALATFHQKIADLKLTIDQDIKKIEPEYFVKSYYAYSHELERSAENIQSNITNPNVNLDLTLFTSRLRKYADWHYPGLIIRPNLESFIDDMVPHDPLYIADISYELLQPALDKFNTQYQTRLRTSVIDENSIDPLLNAIPDGQFGVIFAYNFLNFRPLELFKKYLSEAYQKLKPGGVFILTFNDCDRFAGVQAAEINYTVYTPGYLIRELAQLNGFKVEYECATSGPSTWLELQKPGTLSSLKGGQTLAKILPKAL